MPPLPARAPWQAPELQPILVISGMTSLRKLGTVGSFTGETFALTVACREPSVAVMTASPSPAVRTTPAASTVATAGLEEANFARAVWSPTT